MKKHIIFILLALAGLIFAAPGVAEYEYEDGAATLVKASTDGTVLQVAEAQDSLAPVFLGDGQAQADSAVSSVFMGTMAELFRRPALKEKPKYGYFERPESAEIRRSYYKSQDFVKFPLIPG